MRDRQLEKLASGVADERHTQAESRQTEAGLLQAAHRRMKQLKRMTFKAQGVEFVRVPGDEKLRVRLTRGGGEEAEPEQDVDAMDAEATPDDEDETDDVETDDVEEDQGEDSPAGEA